MPYLIQSSTQKAVILHLLRECLTGRAFSCTMSAMLWGNFEWWCQLQLRTWNVQFRGSNWELTLWQDFFLSITLAPLHDSHHFKTETKQCLIGLGNLGLGILPSLSSSSSHFHRQRWQSSHFLSVCVPQNSPGIHMELNSFPGPFWISEQAIQPKRHCLVNKKVTQTLFFLVMQFWRGLFDRPNKHLLEMAGSNLR